MVSSGQVTGDLDSLTEALSKYDSTIGQLGSSWKGLSHDNLESKASEFVSEYQSALQSAMSAFATACDLYKRYQDIKSRISITENNISEAQKAVNAAVNSGDRAKYAADLANFQSFLAILQKSLEAKRQDINANLAKASSISLSASGTPASVSAPKISVPNSGLVGLATSSSASGARYTKNGASFFQSQGNGDNCGMTAFLMGVNTLLGDNVYTDNVGEWANYGSYSEAIGWGDINGQAQQWINDHGLNNTIEVTGVQNINNKEDLLNHLENGEVVVASSRGAVFKHNDGSFFDAGSGGHYIYFYGTDGNGGAYANDPAWNDPGNYSGVLYDSDNLDAFFNVDNGSITMRSK